MCNVLTNCYVMAENGWETSLSRFTARWWIIAQDIVYRYFGEKTVQIKRWVLNAVHAAITDTSVVVAWKVKRPM